MSVLRTVWDTDELYTKYVAPVLQDNTALIPGVTINANVVQINASAAVYYKLNEGEVTDGVAGRDFDDNEAGNAREIVPLQRSLQISEKMPKVITETTPTEFVGTHLSNSTVKIQNRWGFLGLAALINAGTHKTGAALTKDTIYGDIVDQIAAYDTANDDKPSPTAIIVGPSGLAKIRKSPEFAMNPSLNSTLVQDGQVGHIAGLPVIYAKNADAITAANLPGYSAFTGFEYILLNANAFMAPKIYDYIDVIERSEKFPGSKLIGEVPYGFKVAHPEMVYVRVTSSKVQG